MPIDKSFDKQAGRVGDAILKLLNKSENVASEHPIATLGAATAGTVGGANYLHNYGFDAEPIKDLLKKIPGILKSAPADVSKAVLPAPKPTGPQPEMSDTLMRLAGLGLLGGAGTRLGQELYDRFSKKPKDIDEGRRSMTVDIFDPQEKTRRRALEKAGALDESPYYVPLVLGSLLGGTAAGYHGTRAIAEHLKKKEIEDRLQAAKAEFEEALAEQHAAGNTKLSAAAELSQLMDQLYETGTEKRALLEPWTATIGPTATGGLLTLAALVFALSHKSTYEQMHKADPEVLYSKMLEKQRRQRQAVSPPPIKFQLAGEKRKPDISEELEEAAAPVDESMPIKPQ